MTRYIQPITENRFETLPDGKTKCLKCGHTWHLVKLPKKRGCRACSAVLYPAKGDPTKCHPLCRGLCAFLVIDFLASRNWWVPVPKETGLSWRIALRKQTTSQDIMVDFKCPKDIAQNALKFLLSAKYVHRERGITHPPVDLHKFKQKTYSYPNGRRRVKGRSNRPAFYKYYPTPRAMMIFLDRFPDRLKMQKRGGTTLWKPVRYRKDRTPATVSAMKLPTILRRSQLPCNMARRGKPIPPS